MGQIETPRGELEITDADCAMFQNAVHNQQMTNVLGMVATMNCVQGLLDKQPNVPWPDIPPWRTEEGS